jgi:DNA ligase D-like protein (predicted 3'-phosphoesterase)
MSLEEYKRKRDFGKTKEPAGEVKETGKKIYVMQKHYASHLHWDLRLEKDGVLKSWAVPKEPPTKKGTRRLIISTEDHPIDYADFEGEIPEGQYGAGKVEIWDSGTYEEEKWRVDKEIIVHLKGKRLNGRYCMIRFKKVEDGWLFFRCDKNGE